VVALLLVRRGMVNLSRKKKSMNEKKNNFLTDKTQNRNKNEKIKSQTHIGIRRVVQNPIFHHD
jgi:hypothetical protein